MTTSTHARIPLDSPGDLIAAVPGMLGFVPVSSVVLVTFTGTDTLSVQAVLRTDLPEPHRVVDLVDQLQIVARNHGPSVIAVVVVEALSSLEPDVLPHRMLVDLLAEAFGSEGITLAHAVWVSGVEHGARWRCYEDPECVGIVRDPVTSPVTTAMAVAGSVTFETREDLAAVLTADPSEDLARRARRIEAMSGEPGSPDGQARRVQFRQLVESTIDRASTVGAEGRCSVFELDDETISQLAWALSDSDVRDTCLAYALGEQARPAQTLWTLLTRAIPGKARAEPASLLAVSAYLGGEGALAGMAVAIAIGANPDHGLASTMRDVIAFGIPPTQLRTMLTESFTRIATGTAHG